MPDGFASIRVSVAGRRDSFAARRVVSRWARDVCAPPRDNFARGSESDASRRVSDRGWRDLFARKDLFQRCGRVLFACSRVSVASSRGLFACRLLFFACSRVCVACSRVLQAYSLVSNERKRDRINRRCDCFGRRGLSIPCRDLSIDARRDCVDCRRVFSRSFRLRVESPTVCSACERMRALRPFRANAGASTQYAICLTGISPTPSSASSAGETRGGSRVRRRFCLPAHAGRDVSRGRSATGRWRPCCR